MERSIPFRLSSADLEEAHCKCGGFVDRTTLSVARSRIDGLQYLAVQYSMSFCYVLCAEPLSRNDFLCVSLGMSL